LAEREVGLIRDVFVKADPVNAVVYANNAASYIAQLQTLDENTKRVWLLADLKI